MTDDTTSVPVTIEPQDDGTIRLVNQHVVDELRAENERLKRELTVANDAAAKLDGLTDITTRAVESLSAKLAAAKEALAIERAAHRTAVEAVGTLKTELAAAKAREEKVRADVAGLRMGIAATRDDAGQKGEATVQFCMEMVLRRMDELETFREVK